VRQPRNRGIGPAGLDGLPSAIAVVLGLIVLLVPIPPGSCFADAPVVLIKGGALIDGTGRPPIPHVWILLEGGRIKRIGKAGSFPSPRGSEVVHARGETILPGLIDAHVHLGTSGVVSFTFARPQSPAEEVLRRSLRAELLGGVTQVRDLHMPLEIGRKLKKQLKEEPTLGARLIYAGLMLTAPEGYGAPYAIEVASPEEGRARVEEQVLGGAEVIKIAVTSRTLRKAAIPSMAPEVVRAIVDAAHERGLPVAAHVAAATEADLRNAITGGVDSLEHMPGSWDPLGIPDTLYSTSGLVPEILARHITIVPTLSVEVGETYGPMILELSEDPSLRMRLTPKQREVLASNLEDFSHNSKRQAMAEAGRRRMRIFLEEIGRLHAAGVRLAAGSDAGSGFTFHGNLRTEIELLNQGGLTPLEAIRSATLESARLLGVLEDQGTVEVGKRADLLLVRGDPLKDLRVLRTVDRVVIAGRVVEVQRLVDHVKKEARK
jgi:imidazolonepropionase-like amidohydrolase